MTTFDAESVARAWYKPQEAKKSLGNASANLMAALLAPQAPKQEGDKPGKKKKCRVCSEFEQWGEEAVKTVKTKPVDIKPVASASMQALIEKARMETKHDLEGVSVLSSRGLICPPDSQQLGRATWTFLHTMAAYYPDQPTQAEQANATGFLHAFSKLYPCSYCAKHLQQELKTNAPRVGSRVDFSKWMCDIHNEVNVRLGKPIFDCSRVDERWKDGPADCD